MTIEELKASNDMYVYATDICEILGTNAQSIREQARQGTLTFPYYRSGNTTKIFRKQFLDYIGAE